MDYYGAKARGEQIVRDIEAQTHDPHERMRLLAAAEEPIKRAADAAYREWTAKARYAYADREQP
jgi:hypothetical protein